MSRNYREEIQKLTMEDDTFFTKCFSGDNECSALILRIILDRDDLTVIEARTQNWIQNIKGHSVKLDLFCRDAEGNIFDVEIQKIKSGASSRRARYYSAAMDTEEFDKNKDYDALPESYVIFITPEDALGNGQAIYEIERYVKGTWKEYGDGTHIIHVSADLTEEGTPLGNLMHDLRCADPDEMHYTELRNKVSYYKRTKKGVAEMSAVFEKEFERVREMGFKEGRNEGLEIGLKEGEARGISKGEANGIRKVAKNLISSGMPLSEVAKNTNLSIKEVNNLRKSMSL